VICNDVFAYIWGITTGRTPLIKLSPKKTVEGFVGAFWSTIVFGIVWGTYFMRFDYMICPVHDLGVSVWSSMRCTPNPIFVWREWKIWMPLAMFLSAVVSNGPFPCQNMPHALRLVPAADPNNPLRSVPAALAVYVVLRVAGGAIRRVLCVRVQARVQYQGFWA
jgi:phosphatidate cytidylyltransferase